MSVNPDYLIERKRTKFQVMRWKLFAIILGIIVFFASHNHLVPENNISTGVLQLGNHIGRIHIDNLIHEDHVRLKKLATIEKNDKVKALIVNINSQGGSVVGSEMLYNALRKISKQKPVVVVMGSVAASGGYLASLGADYIIAHNGTLTGSIGVIMQSAEITDLAKMLGVALHSFKSDELKAVPNFMEKLTPRAHKATMENIYAVYDYFAEVVADRRNMNLEYVKTIADGRVYSGRKALELKLIDAIGNEDTAISWLQKEKGVSQDLEVMDIKLERKDRLLLDVELKNNQERFIDSFFVSAKRIVTDFLSFNFASLQSIM
ncbi:signal peptide peptidase SppA [Rickettsiaceae bacterium]|nr:signal peptide peptidase SppA [Rickettsiaceae bacterium]